MKRSKDSVAFDRNTCRDGLVRHVSKKGQCLGPRLKGINRNIMRGRAPFSSDTVISVSNAVGVTHHLGIAKCFDKGISIASDTVLARAVECD